MRTRDREGCVTGVCTLFGNETDRYRATRQLFFRRKLISWNSSEKSIRVFSYHLLSRRKRGSCNVALERSSECSSNGLKIAYIYDPPGFRKDRMWTERQGESTSYTSDSKRFLCTPLTRLQTQHTPPFSLSTDQQYSLFRLSSLRCKKELKFNFYMYCNKKFTWNFRYLYWKFLYIN